MPKTYASTKGSSGGGSGTVTSVTAGDTSIVVGGTATDPTIETATLDVIATDHPPAAAWSNNSKKITSVANGSSAQDAAAFGQIPTTLPPNGSAGGDLTGTYPNPTLAAAGPGATGPLGSATVTPIVTIDAKGRVIALSSATTVPTNAAGGDLTGNYPNPTLAAAGPGATGPLGSATVAPIVTIDAKGRVTALTSATIVPTNAAGGDLTGNYPNPTLGTSGVTATTYGDASHVTQVAFDAKGRATSASSVAIAIAESAVTNLVTDLAAKMLTATYDPAAIAQQLVGLTATQTLTNKRHTKRSSVTSGPGATPSINSDNLDIALFTALATAITSMTTNLSGTPTEGQTLWIAFTDNGTARAITWGTSFEASTIALPTTTVISTRLDVGFVWNTVTSKFRCVAVA